MYKLYVDRVLWATFISLEDALREAKMKTNKSHRLIVVVAPNGDMQYWAKPV